MNLLHFTFREMRWLCRCGGQSYGCSIDIIVLERLLSLRLSGFDVFWRMGWMFVVGRSGLLRDFTSILLVVFREIF